MVKICNQKFSQDKEIIYSQYFSKYPYQLSDFQKYAIEGIVENSHVLITAHTGSGKTLPAEFAIEYFIGLGKKVIYTSPIKALSNQKFFEFQQKFPHISFGVLTGDIKTNPNAQVLIMTTEILMNTLYLNSTSSTIQPDFSMDFEKDLACVIFDEIHYINDPDRGRVWEESIMMLHPHIQMVMLSATIDSPEEFANWIESVKTKSVNLCSTSHRVVPLTHYTFMTTTNGIFKKIKDKALEQQIKNWVDKPQVISSSSGVFNEVTWKTNKNFLDLFVNKELYIKRQHVLNQVCKYMVEHDMLPALCFVLSRKQLEIAAKEITVPLLEFDSKVAYTIRYECEQIIRKLPNFQEYLELPEYQSMVQLLEKGIAIHHSGVMPILKEMVEILYGKGYIKLLFATETFSIGVNMPTKTVIFTDVTKYDGNIQRIFYSHEYTQMAGRAGRRGIDKIGNVIHLSNLFRTNIVGYTDYKNMLSGKPQKLISKFKISYSLILNLLENGFETKDSHITYTEKSMIQQDLLKKINSIQKDISKLNYSHEPNLSRTPRDIIEEFISINSNIKMLANKKRKESERRLTQIKDEYKFLNGDIEIYNKWKQTFEENEKFNNQLSNVSGYLSNSIEKVLDYLKELNFIRETKLTELGKIAVHLREVHCLIFSKLIESNIINENLEPSELVGIFSCLTNIGVQEDYKSYNISDKIPEKLKNIIKNISDMYIEYSVKEDNIGIKSGIDYSFHFDLIEYIIEWCESTNVVEAKSVLQRLLEEKGVFLGEFVKAILKINNIANEMIKVTESVGKIGLTYKLSQIPDLTLKFVATAQSLYV
jgi:superfamily II RNA helicase